MTLRMHYVLVWGLIALTAILTLAGYTVASPSPLFATATIIGPFVLQVAYLLWALTFRRSGRSTSALDGSWLLLLVLSASLSKQEEFGAQAIGWASQLRATAPNPAFIALFLIIMHVAWGVWARRKANQLTFEARPR